MPQVDQLKQQIEQLRQQGQYEQAIRAATELTQHLRTTVGEARPEFVLAANTLAELYHQTGQHRQARDLYRWAVSTGETVLGQTSPELAHIRGNLAELYLDLEDLEQARIQLAAVLALRGHGLSDDQPEIARALTGLGRLHLARGEYDQAGPVLNEALALREKLYGPDRPEMAESWRYLAQLHEARGAYLQAEPLYRQAFRRRLATFGKQHPLVAESMVDLAGVYHRLARYGEAEDLYQRALKIYQNESSQNQPQIVIILKALVVLWLDLGRYTEAEAYGQDILTRQKSLVDEKHPDFARSVDLLARVKYRQGNYDEARRLQMWALQIKKAALGEKHPAVAETLDDLGQVWQVLGNYTQAEQHFEEALAIRQTAFGERHPAVATSLDHLAALYQARGELSETRARLERALALRQELLGEQHPDVAASLHHLAELYRVMGDETPARSSYEQALAIRQAAFGEEHPTCADTRHGLGQLLYARGELNESQTHLEQALAIRRKIWGAQHPEVAAALNDLAEIEMARGDYAGAESHLLQARQIWEAAHGRQHPKFALFLHNLAELYQAQGRYDEAKALYQWALQIRRQTLGATHPEVAQTLHHLATLYAALDLDPLALETFQQAAALTDQMIGQVFAIGSERQRLIYAQVFRQNFETFLSFISQRLAGSTAAGQAAAALVLRRKGLSAEALAIQREAVLEQAYPALQPKLQALTALRRQIAQKLLAGPGESPPELYQQTLAGWQQEREQLEAELALHIPAMNLAARLQGVDDETIRPALPAEAALIEWVRFRSFDFKAVPARQELQWGPTRYLALLLTQETTQVLDLGQAEPVDKLIAQFRATITGEVEDRGTDIAKEAEPDATGGDSDQRGAARKAKTQPVEATQKQLGQALRVALFDPLRPALASYRRLFLAPDGDLARLPFEILPTEAESRLIDSFQISYLSAARDVLRLGRPVPGQPSISLVLADPDFDLAGRQPSENSGRRSPVAGRRSSDLDRAGFPFTRLPGTRREGEAIAGMLEVTPLLAEAAVKGRLKESRSPRILHLATHGFFLEDQAGAPGATASGLARLARLENPLLRSGLALAGANRWHAGQPLPAEAENGILTAEDVSGLSLEATELVVLSACETGLGEIQVGEGVFGLRRAFVLAGAKTLVMSLWKVPDEATQQLMTDFYRRLLAGEARREALRQAQLTLKQQEKYASPYFWGAFICQGDPGPLEQFGQAKVAGGRSQG